MISLGDVEGELYGSAFLKISRTYDMIGVLLKKRELCSRVDLEVHVVGNRGGNGSIEVIIARIRRGVGHRERAGRLCGSGVLERRHHLKLLAATAVSAEIIYGLEYVDIVLFAEHSRKKSVEASKEVRRL